MENIVISALQAVLEDIILENPNNLCTLITHYQHQTELHLLLNTQLVALGLCSLLKKKRYRMEGFFEEWINKYIETDFFTHFRMKRITFENLVMELSPSHISRIKEHKGGRLPVPLDKRLMMTLWYLAKNDLLSSVSDRFNVSLSTACTACEQMCSDILDLKKKYIVWPTSLEARVVSNNFYELHGFPDVIGSLDCTHITATVPSDQTDSYLDRKFNTSIIIQGITTSEHLLTNVFVGFPGACHDARVLKSSKLYNTIERKGERYLFYGKYHLLGDSAYPCKTWLLTPYRKTHNLTPIQINYNLTHSKTRVKIEHVFGILKSRWQILQNVNVYSIPKAVCIITACCVLHNFCILGNDLFNTDEARKTEDDTVINLEGDDAGYRKRDEIANMLHNIIPRKRQRLIFCTKK